LNDYGNIFVAVGLVGVFLCCVPSVMFFGRFPGGERFSELYVLGPTHMAEGYPFNVSAGRNYLVYLGVGNHLGNVAYYQIVVKLRNGEEALPNSTAEVASPLPALYTCDVFLTDGQVWEGALSFSFPNVLFEGNVATVWWISINGALFVVDKSAVWDNENNGYFYELFMELWVFNTTSGSFSFHNRFVGFWLNATGTV
jgi:hypothetical protein